MTTSQQLCDAGVSGTVTGKMYSGQNGSSTREKTGDSEETEGEDCGETEKDDSRSYASSGCNMTPRFVATLTIMIIVVMAMTIYNVGVVRTLERRFGLQSSQTGLMMAMNDVSHIIVVVFIGYLGRKAHKPKVLSITVLFSALAGILMALPHFVFPKMNDSLSFVNGTENADKLLCVPSFKNHSQGNNDGCEMDETGWLDESSAGYHAYLVFLAAQFLDGIGGSGLMTLGIAYIDENSPRTKSSLYLGVVMGSYALGPIVGFMLSALCLRIPESPLNPVTTDPGEPAFIGAWWLGYAICAACIVISAIPMWFFPRRVLPQNDVRKNRKVDESPSKMTTIRQEFKDFVPSLLRMLRNKAYMVLQGALILAVYIVYGIYMNMPRYIEVHFLQPAFVASIVVAINTAFAGMIGGFLGGGIMSRMKLAPPGGVKLMMFSLTVGCLGIVISMVLGCPRINMAGDWHPEIKTLSVDSPTCTRDCDCATEEGAYKPVCGSDNLTYFSPCHAGCKLEVNGTYDECGCLGPEGSAKDGVCNTPCNLLIPYAVSLFITSVLSSVGRVPTTIVQLRIVEEDMRSFALGLSSFATNLIGFIPGPVLFGAIIDSTCILWQTTCKKTGACLLYDVTRFRLLTHGISLAFLFGGLVLTVVLYLIVRHMDFNENESSDHEEVNNKDNITENPRHEIEALLERRKATKTLAIINK